MRSLFAMQLVHERVQQASLKHSAGRRVVFAAGHTRAIASQVIDLRRLPVRPWQQPLQNASGQFYWLEGYSHPDGGDIP